MTTAIIYTRTSNTHAAAAQERACRAHADRHGISVVAVHQDVGAGWGGPERPGWTAVEAAITDGAIGAVIVTGPDRITRDLTQWERIAADAKRAGVAIITATEDAS